MIITHPLHHNNVEQTTTANKQTNKRIKCGTSIPNKKVPEKIVKSFDKKKKILQASLG